MIPRQRIPPVNMALGCEGWPFSFVGETKKTKIKSRNLKMGDKVVCVRRDGHGGGEWGESFQRGEKDR